jgi:hypothetical protein
MSTRLQAHSTQGAWPGWTLASFSDSAWLAALCCAQMETQTEPHHAWQSGCLASDSNEGDHSYLVLDNKHSWSSRPMYTYGQPQGAASIQDAIMTSSTNI